MKLFLKRKRKYIIGSLFGIIFVFTLVYNIPSWALSNVVENYSHGRLKFYDTEGTFWKGSGLLVAISSNKQSSAPLMLLDWQIKLGLSKLVDIKFNVGNKQVAELYINSKGANLDKLNLALSITQVEQLFDIVKDMSVSGNIVLASDHILAGKKLSGTLNVTLSNISSGISRVNPLGSYSVSINADSGSISVSSNPGSVLILNGNGSIQALTLSARINEANREDMLQFITMMGVPGANGAYQLKIF